MTRDATPSSGPPESGAPDPGLIRHRERLWRELRRANLAWGVLLFVITALTFGVIWKASQSNHEADRANRSAVEARTQAERAEAELWNARLAEARATRVAGGPGARSKARSLLEQLTASNTLAETQRLALRTEAIAQFAMVDVVPPEIWVSQRNQYKQTWDPPMQLYIQSFQTNHIAVRAHPSGQLRHEFPGPKGAVRKNCGFSPDGRYFACHFRNPSVLICWRTDDQSIVYSNRTTRSDDAAAPFFSPDSRLLANATKAGLVLNSLADRRPTITLPNRAVAEFSPDSNWLMTGQGNQLEIYSTVTGRPVIRRSLEFRADCLAWHPDGKRIAAGGQSGRIIVWLLPSGWEAGLEEGLPWNLALEELGFPRSRQPSPIVPGGPKAGSPIDPAQIRSFESHVGLVVGVWFSRDGSMLLSQSWDDFSILWDVRTGQKLLAESRMRLERFSTDGQSMLAYTDNGRKQGPARLIERTGFKTLLHTGPAAANLSGFACSKDGRFVATDHTRYTILWDNVTGREVGRLNGRSPVFSADDGSVFTVATTEVLQFDLPPASSQPKGTNWLARRVNLPGIDISPNTLNLNTASLAPDGRTLVITAFDGGVILADLQNQTPPRRFKIPAHFASISQDASWLVTQKHMDSAWIVNLTNANLRTHLGNHRNIAFSPTGSRFALSTEKFLVLQEFDANRSNRWLLRWSVPLDIGVGQPAPFAFSPDGRTIAVSYNRFDLRLLDAASGKELATLSPPDPFQISSKEAIAFSEDGCLLRAIRNDGRVVEWNLPIVRRALAELGLNWSDSPSEPVRAPDGSGPAQMHSKSSTKRTIPSPWSFSLPSAAAVTAGLFALVAGVVLFLHQRRTVAAYARAEDLAAEKQQQLVHAQEALFQSQKMEALGTLAAGVAHDFNNLLSIIRMSNQLVARATKPEGNTRENIDAIERAVKQGKAIVDSMLGYSRRPVHSVSEYSVTKAVSDTVALLSRQFLSGLRLDLELAPDCPPIHGSPARLEQVLLNLVLNASEAMHGSGSLLISARKVSTPHAGVLTARTAPVYVALEVTDTGPGIPVDVLPRIFEPFFTTKTAGAHRGTGLGLSLVYSIARQDGWGLDVTSPPGKGATFRLILPAIPGGGHRLPTSALTPIEAKVRIPKPT